MKDKSQSQNLGPLLHFIRHGAFIIYYSPVFSFLLHLQQLDPVGLLAEIVERRTGIAEVKGSNHEQT